MWGTMMIKMSVITHKVKEEKSNTKYEQEAWKKSTLLHFHRRLSTCFYGPVASHNKGFLCFCKPLIHSNAYVSYIPTLCLISRSHYTYISWLSRWRVEGVVVMSKLGEMAALQETTVHVSAKCEATGCFKWDGTIPSHFSGDKTWGQMCVIRCANLCAHKMGNMRMKRANVFSSDVLNWSQVSRPHTSQSSWIFIPTVHYKWLSTKPDWPGLLTCKHEAVEEWEV